MVKAPGLLKLKTLAEKCGLLSVMECDPVYIDNKELDGFLTGMKEIDCRITDCSACGYCAAWTQKAVKMDKNFQSEMLELYSDAFEALYSGKLWCLEARSPKNSCRS